MPLCCAEQEPRSAHGRAVNKSRAEQEPRSAHGRAVKNLSCDRVKNNNEEIFFAAHLVKELFSGKALFKEIVQPTLHKRFDNGLL